MKIIDLSHPLAAGMPVQPGDEPPFFGAAANLARDGYATLRMALCSHTGTHLDVPSHVIPGAPSLDQLPLEAFYGKASILDFCASAKRMIGPDELEPHAFAVSASDFILLHTGWGARWGTEDFFREYPVLTAAGASWLAARRLKGIGVDTPSADAANAPGLPVHRALLGRGIIILENLANLEKAPPAFTLACFPLPVAGGDGSPVRAVAII